MAWRTMEVREQRVRFVVAAHRREKSLAELCREFDISRPAGTSGCGATNKAGWKPSPSAAGVRTSARDAKTRRSNSRWSSCGGAIPTGERASCGCCWPSKG